MGWDHGSALRKGLPGGGRWCRCQMARVVPVLGEDRCGCGPGTVSSPGSLICMWGVTPTSQGGLEIQKPRRSVPQALEPPMVAFRGNRTRGHIGKKQRPARATSVQEGGPRGTHRSMEWLGSSTLSQRREGDGCTASQGPPLHPRVLTPLSTLGPSWTEPVLGWARPPGRNLVCRSGHGPSARLPITPRLPPGPVKFVATCVALPSSQAPELLEHWPCTLGAGHTLRHWAVIVRPHWGQKLSLRSACSPRSTGLAARKS